MLVDCEIKRPQRSRPSPHRAIQSAEMPCTTMFVSVGVASAASSSYSSGDRLVWQAHKPEPVCWSRRRLTRARDDKAHK
jgi:hypothetical protein